MRFGLQGEFYWRLRNKQRIVLFLKCIYLRRLRFLNAELLNKTKNKKRWKWQRFRDISDSFKVLQKILALFKVIKNVQCLVRWIQAKFIKIRWNILSTVDRSLRVSHAKCTLLQVKVQTLFIPQELCTISHELQRSNFEL